MSPTFSKTEKHSVYLKEDVFHCKLMLLNRQLSRERESEIKKTVLAIPKLGAHYIEVQIQTPEATYTLSVFFH